MPFVSIDCSCHKSISDVSSRVEQLSTGQLAQVREKMMKNDIVFVAFAFVYMFFFF